MGADPFPLAVAALAHLPAAARDEKIVTLCDQAIEGLTEARSLDDVLGIRNAAEAFGLYTRKYKAALAAQNHCQLVVLLAEARIGAELKAAQTRGEVASADGGVNQHRREGVRASDTLATLPEVGIPRQRAAEMKRLSEVGEPAIRAEVERATEAGRRPSRNRLLERIPVLANRPPELDRFALWLRSGASFIPTLGDPQAFVALAEQHRAPIRLGEVETAHAFLHAIASGVSQGSRA